MASPSQQVNSFSWFVFPHAHGWLTRGSWRRLSLLLCVSLTTSDVVAFRAIYVSSLEKIPFWSFAHVFNMGFFFFFERKVGSLSLIQLE